MITLNIKGYPIFLIWAATTKKLHMGAERGQEQFFLGGRISTKVGTRS
jgi:hypothetical protein